MGVFAVVRGCVRGCVRAGMSWQLVTAWCCIHSVSCRPAGMSLLFDYLINLNLYYDIQVEVKVYER